MKVLVTGTEGYIGTELLPQLAARGHEVVGLDTGFYREGRLYGTIAEGGRHIKRDTRHVTRAELEGFDAVVHLAELSNDPLGALNPDLTFRVNHLGSVALARAARDAGVARFIYASSCSVYGAGSDDVKTERSEPNPQTAYATCKALVERDVAALAGDGFSPVFLRNATAFGASPRMRFDLVLNNLAGLAWTTGEIRVTSDGTPWRPLVHLRDIGQAVACALEAPRDAVHGQLFNVGETEQNYRVREIAQVVAEAFPGCALSFGTADGDSRSYRVSFDKIHAHLPEFRCQYDAAAGARELHGIFQQIGMSREVFEDRPYTRLKQLRHLLDTRQIDQDLFWSRV
jgi:nucleoside-diphosphate-sugar epimerase